LDKFLGSKSQNGIIYDGEIMPRGWNLIFSKFVELVSVIYVSLAFDLKKHTLHSSFCYLFFKIKCVL